jgi:hypothetical protein
MLFLEYWKCEIDTFLQFYESMLISVICSIGLIVWNGATKRYKVDVFVWNCDEFDLITMTCRGYVKLFMIRTSNKLKDSKKVSLLEAKLRDCNWKWKKNITILFGLKFVVGIQWRQIISNDVCF